MTHHTWTTEKPDFTEECILITATWNSHPLVKYWDYTLYIIKKTEGFNDNAEPCFYMGVFSSEGNEWGDLADLGASKYLTMPLLK